MVVFVYTEDQKCSKFKELLQYAYGYKMCTLVLVVGDEILYHDINDEIQRKFVRTLQRSNPPIVLLLQKDCARLFTGIDWVSRRADVNGRIRGYLKSQTSFVFYCDCGFSNVYESSNWEQAVTDIYELPVYR